MRYQKYLHMRISPDFWEDIDKVRRSLGEKNIPSRSEMIRRLVKVAAKTVEEDREKKPDN